jgi:xanthine/uracil permease
MIFSIGLRLVADNVPLTQRNLTIVAISIVLGLGVEVRPNVVAQFPEDLQVLLGSGLLVGGVTILVLNAVIPGDGGLTTEGQEGTEPDPTSAEQL